MKMRVLGNSIRLRLTQSEVAQFGQTGTVAESIEFGGGQNFVYQLKASPSATAVRAEFEADRLTVSVPQRDAENLAGSDQIGIAAEQDAGGGKTLSILIEKDFTCLEPRSGEDDRDTFPHPRSKC